MDIICDYCGQCVGVVDGRVVNHGFKTSAYIFGDVCVGSGAPYLADCCGK